MIGRLRQIHRYVMDRRGGLATALWLLSIFAALSGAMMVLGRLSGGRVVEALYAVAGGALYILPWHWVVRAWERKDLAALRNLEAAQRERQRERDIKRMRYLQQHGIEKLQTERELLANTAAKAVDNVAYLFENRQLLDFWISVDAGEQAIELYYSSAQAVVQAREELQRLQGRYSSEGTADSVNIADPNRDRDNAIVEAAADKLGDLVFRANQDEGFLSARLGKQAQEDSARAEARAAEEASRMRDEMRQLEQQRIAEMRQLEQQRADLEQQRADEAARASAAQDARLAQIAESTEEAARASKVLEEEAERKKREREKREHANKWWT